MRIAMILWLLLFSVVPAIRSQAEGYPPCSAAELTFVLAQRGEFDAVFETALKDEASADFLLAYSQAQIAWRDKLWMDLPPCAEAIDAAVLMTEAASDTASMAALTYAGLPLTANPYLEREAAAGRAQERVQGHFDGIAALLESGDRPQEPTPGGRTLESCETDEMKILLEVLRASEDLIVSGTEVLSPEALAEYADAMLGWRDGIWAQLMPCDQALRLGKLMSQAASDIVTGYAFVFAGVSASENPFNQLLEEELIELGKFMEALMVVLSVEKTARSLEEDPPELPACSADDMSVAASKLSPLFALAKEAAAFQSRDDWLDYIDKMISWREALWSNVPLCAETIEISLVAMHAANDFATAFALAFAGKGLNATPYLEMSNSGFNQVRLWTQEKAADVDGSQPSSQVNRLPACTEADSRALQVNATLVGVFWSMLADIESQDDLLSFGEKQVDLREDIWTQLPPCLEAIQVGRLVLQITGDVVPAVALLMFAGVSADDISYLSAISSAGEQVQIYETMFDEA